MDLRKKESPLQIFGEFTLRFRLIFVVIFAMFYVVLASNFNEIFAYAFASIESALKLAGQNTTLITPIKEFVVPVFSGAVVLFLVFFLFVRLAFFKALLPALLTAFFWTAVAAKIQLPQMEYLSLLTAEMVGILWVAIIAGILLGKGTPVAGSSVGGFTRAFFPVVILHVVSGGVCGYFFRSETSLSVLILFPLISLALYLFAAFPMFSFAPMSRMRAAQRTMKIKD